MYIVLIMVEDSFVAYSLQVELGGTSHSCLSLEIVPWKFEYHDMSHSIHDHLPLLASRGHSFICSSINSSTELLTWRQTSSRCTNTGSSINLKTAGKKYGYDLIQSVKLNPLANLSKSQRTS